MRPDQVDFLSRNDAAAAILAVVETIQSERLLENVRAREAQIRECCRTGPVSTISGMGDPRQ